MKIYNDTIIPEGLQPADYGEVLQSGYTDGYAEGYEAYECHEYEKEYLTIDALEDGNIITWSNAVQYSINGGEWQTCLYGGTISVLEGDKVRFKGNYLGAADKGLFENTTVKYNVYGNIMSLAFGDDFDDKLTIENYNQFARCFYGSYIISAKNLILPATYFVEDSGYVYWAMFGGCIRLTTPPELPAESLNGYCYFGMFQGCTSLTSAPELPATKLTQGCYANMFDGCSNLTQAPAVLPATELATRCYQNMFFNCTSLTKAPELPATILEGTCYYYMFYNCTSLTTAPVLPASALAKSCYDGMFQGCTGLTQAPALPATSLTQNCYSNMFKGCSNITSAPELSAPVLVDFCYSGMFDGCTRLNYIKCLATNISGTDCLENWVRGVSNSGTFVKAASMEDWNYGDDGIPGNWEVLDA